MTQNTEIENSSKEYLRFGKTPEEAAYKLFTQAREVLLKNESFKEAAAKAFLDKEIKLTFNSGGSSYLVRIDSNNENFPLWDSMTISKSQGGELRQIVQFSLMYDDWDKRRILKNKLPLLTFQDSGDKEGVQFDTFSKVDSFIQELTKD